MFEAQVCPHVQDTSHIFLERDTVSSRAGYNTQLYLPKLNVLRLTKNVHLLNT